MMLILPVELPRNCCRSFDMKPEAQRIAIAKACGLTIVSDGITHHLTPCGKKTERYPEGCGLTMCPDYLNDLNAIREAVQIALWDDCLCQNYCGHLWEVVCPQFNKMGGLNAGIALWLIQSTAAQRSEALLKTLGLWKE